MNSHGFTLLKTDPASMARLGELTTPHGKVPTPAFLPVATQGTVKTLLPGEVRDMGYSMLLSNTYHLYLRPGMSIIEKLGGLHKFMGWNGVILTDSGGYQVFSLATLRRITDDGVTFRSHIDGSEHVLTPDLAVCYQEIIGADIIMALDECPAPDSSYEKIGEAVRRTHLWAERCLKAQSRTDQALYAIIQGGTFPELRHESAQFLTTLDFPGYAIGGLSLGEPKTTMNTVIEQTVAWLPADKPRYLMGVGSPEDLVEGVARGIDLFDCALPTRVARNGSLFTPAGRVNIRNAVYRQMEQAVDPACDCFTCRSFSAAYLHHLFNSRELLAYRLATIHNLTFISRLMSVMRREIADGSFGSFRQEFLAAYRTTNEPMRLEQKRKWLKEHGGESMAPGA